MLFNTLYSTPGTNANSLKYIDKCVESVKGFSNHLINKINHYEFFNPYLFIIRDFFSSMNEFNRKIEEFNNMLNIVALLSEPKILEHNYYKNENGEIITTNLVLISWKNIIDCMNIFNGNNLLPTEKELLVSLCKNYIPYDVDYIGSLKEYEEYVIRDRAFLRRFERIDVAEPTETNVSKIDSYTLTLSQSFFKKPYFSAHLPSIQQQILPSPLDGLTKT